MVKRNSIIRWKRNKYLKMLMRQKLPMVFLIILFAACSTAPQVTFQGYTPSDKKLASKVALIISDELRNTVHTSTVNIRCVDIRSKQILENAVLQTDDAVGVSAEDLFIKGLPYLFDKVDSYRNIAEIKNKADYDYIMIPNVIVFTYYDRQTAINRNIWVEQYNSIKLGPATIQLAGKPITSIKGTPIPVSASSEFQLKVKDAKSDETIETFAGKGSSASNWVVKDVYCSFGYSSPIGEAMSIAFERLLRETERGLIPPELSANAYFSDRNSLFPNNILDVDENAEIVITAMNNGKGIGYGTNLGVISDNPKISVRDITIGDIPPGETRNISINLKAAKDLEDGRASFRLNLKEKRGYNAKEVILNVPTSDQINRVIDSIIAKVKSQLSQKGWKRIAMAEIESHTGSYTNLESYLIEEFYARLGNMKEFSVAEKPLLNQALTALKTNFSDLVSPASEKVLVNHDAVKKLGALTGADVIFLVTVTDMEDSVRINNSFVDIETGEVYTIAGEDIGKRRSL